MTQSTNHPVKVLFVCVGNACRSQMAEAWANHFGRGQVEAHSAGMYPYGSIPEDTHTVMGEKGIALDAHCSKGLRDVPVGEMDVVVGMGREVKWSVPEDFKGRIVEWKIPDPFARGLETYREVRDLIEQEVKALLTELNHPQTSA
jgi:protein-tyrosine-phosphatase